MEIISGHFPYFAGVLIAVLAHVVVIPLFYIYFWTAVKSFRKSLLEMSGDVSYNIAAVHAATTYNRSLDNEHYHSGKQFGIVQPLQPVHQLSQHQQPQPFVLTTFQG